MEETNKDKQLMNINCRCCHNGASTSRPRYPPGYRFLPTDRELITEYLAKKVNNEPIPIEEINVVNLYDHPPDYLAEGYPPLNKSWYFFTPRDRKYPNGKRPSRSVGEIGHWRATGSDNKILSTDLSTVIGSNMSLTYYIGKAKDPTKKKTNWIMNEYKLNIPSREPDSTTMLLDDWVLCRIHRGSKGSKSKETDVAEEGSVDGENEDVAQPEALLDNRDNEQSHVGPYVDDKNNCVDHGWLMKSEYPEEAVDYSGQLALLPDVTTSQNHYFEGIMPLPNMDDSFFGDIDFTELDNFLRDELQLPADEEEEKSSDGIDDQNMGSKRKRN